MPNQSPEPTPITLAVPPSRLTSGDRLQRLRRGPVLDVRPHHASGMSYISDHRSSLERRHYIIDATTQTMWFNFYEGKLGEFIGSFDHDFCLVINGSRQFNDAFILPFKDFKDFFSSDFLDATHRWSGNVRAADEVIMLSLDGKTKEKFGHEYHNAFDLLQDAPSPLPEAPDKGGCFNRDEASCRNEV
jgi:hypothetical protein